MTSTQAPGDGRALEIVRIEAEQHQETLRRTIGVINRLMPGTIVGSILLALVVASGTLIPQDWACAIFVLSVALVGLTLHNQWVEFFDLIRYKYIVLYPRLYEVAGHKEWPNYLEFSAPRSLRSWVPALFLNVLIFTVAFAFWSRFLLVPALEGAKGPLESWVLCLIPGLGLLLTIWTAHLVLVAARTLERDVKFALGRQWDVGGPFRTTLQLIPYGDGRRFMVHDALEVDDLDRKSPKRYVIPEGFLTDLASVPRFLWPLFPPWARYGPAAVLHDFLYTLDPAGCSRKVADQTFHRVMKAMGVEAFERRSVYRAVRCFGRGARRKAVGRRPLTQSEIRRVKEAFHRANRGLIVEEAAGDRTGSPMHLKTAGSLGHPRLDPPARHDAGAGGHDG